MEIAMDLTQMIISSIFGAFIGAASLYFTAYMKEKGKARALFEDVSRLEDEKQSITSRYQREIEELKKTHQLDIEKRKHQYESKKSQYYQFMNELDDFNGCLHRTLTEEFAQIMLSYYASMNGVSTSSSHELTVEFNNKAQAAVANIKSQEAKLFSQLNAFKLSAPDEIVSILKELILDIQSSEKILVNALEYIGSPDFQFSKKVPEDILSISDKNQNNLIHTKKKLMRSLRQDLDKI